MISVIIPVYNKQDYLRQCLQSLFNQTRFDGEILLIDDGSTDESLAICREYEKKYSNIHVFHQENAGVSVARNNGIAHARGEWISFVDPDDYVDERLYETLLREAEDCDIIACSCYAFDEEKKYWNAFYDGDRVFASEQDKDELFCQLLYDRYAQPGKTYTAIGVPWGKLYRASLIRKHGLRFHEQLRRQQDNAFNMHAFAYANKIKYVNRPLYDYRLDNVTSYYVSKYNSYASKNALYLQRERYDFFVKKQKMRSSLVRELYDNETVCLLFGALNQCIMNRQNPADYKTRKEAYQELLSDEAFHVSLERARRKNIKGMFHRIVFVFMKKEYFLPIFLIWKFRKSYEMIKFRHKKMV